MKKIRWATLLIVSILIGGGIIGSFISLGEETIDVYYNGQNLDFDSEPEIINGRTMVPLRTIFEALDMTVIWDNKLQKVTAVKEGLEIVLTIGSEKPLVNGREITIDAKPYIVNGRTMVPLRFIAESTGAVVEWDGISRSITITENDLGENLTNPQSGSNQVDALRLTYKIVDTGQTTLYSDKSTLAHLGEGDDYYGQDGNYDGYQPDYTDHDDGTVTDHVTDLMWQQTMDEKMTYDEAISYANTSQLGGYDDWRIPTIKELFSLIMYTGKCSGESANILYIDTDYFDQPIGDTSIGEREIDAQVWSSTKYVGLTMDGNATLFGVNFVDGRIKGYGITDPRTRSDHKMYFRLVRGNEAYGENMFVDNGDGTITDLASGLMWQMSDDGITRNWEEALDYSETLELGGYDDWRLPNSKELQSIVDYSKSMQTTGTAAINDMFVLTPITDPNGDKNYGFYWTGTTHQDGMNISDSAAYVAFGEAQGDMFGGVIDVHGAGAVRSDPKSGDASNYPTFFGPQGDVRYVYNYVLSVRTVD